MAITYPGERVKLADKTLFSAGGKEVHLEFSTCDMCGRSFIGPIHNDPHDHPEEHAISFCGCNPDTWVD